jgi:hypothetical protein
MIDLASLVLAGALTGSPGALTKEETGERDSLRRQIQLVQDGAGGSGTGGKKPKPKGDNKGK